MGSRHSSVNAIVNMAIRERGLNISNVFSGTFIPKDEVKKTRLSIPNEVLLKVQRECVIHTGQEFAFPKYCNTKKCNSNSASAALNKWLKPRVPERCVIHSFRHSLRDRLRAIECPADIIDAIGGWKTEGVGHQYGRGYGLHILEGWMKKMTQLQK